MRVRTAAGTAASMAGVLAATILAAGQAASPVPLEKLKLPAGFKVALYADGVRSARGMALGAKGTVFVGSMNASTVYALVDRNHDDVISADEVKVVATGLLQPTGVAFHDGALYIAAATKIVRLDAIEDHLDSPPAPVVVVDKLPSQYHSWKFLAFGPDGLMYVSDGSPCKVCDNEKTEPRYAAILRMKPDGSSPEVFAHGVRNSVGFDWDPATKNLWFSDNGRDEMGDDMPSDELNVATKAGEHFGFPFCHQGDTLDPDLGKGRTCAEFVPPAQKVGAHVASIGLRFYGGTMFPAKYRGGIFIAQHGSWNRSVPAGYRVMFASVKADKVTAYEPFVEGFLEGTRSTSTRGATALQFGRPADVQPLRDGSLLISEDTPGRIYRVTYGK
jgi:glucose/arabinose dehydrogenase